MPTPETPTMAESPPSGTSRFTPCRTESSLSPDAKVFVRFLAERNPRFPVASGPQAIGIDFPAPGSPSFSLDPEASDPSNPLAAPRAIRYIGRGGLCEGWVMSEEVGSTNWSEAQWDLRVRGTNPGGSTVSIQATGINCHPYSS